MRHNAIISSLICFLLFALVGNGIAATPTLPIVELATPIHFLTPAGEDVEVAEGAYRVDAAESWLKLFPEGQAPSAVILLEAKRGDHDEELTDSIAYLEANPDNPDVFHLAMLHKDGTGFEAVGSASGVYPRGTRFLFTRPTRSPYIGQSTRQEEQCSPLQVSSLRPIEVAPIFEGGSNRVGVAFKIAATVRNTNRKRVYSAHPKTFFNMFASDSTGKAHGSNQFNLDTHIAPGGSQAFTGVQRVALRRPDDRAAPFVATLQAYVFNKHCKDPKKQLSQSTFVYDLMPVLLARGEVKRLSGRIKGGSEATRPRPGTGAPAPRR